MIPLRVAIDPFPISEPLVIRLQNGGPSEEGTAGAIHRGQGFVEYDVCGLSLTVRTSDPDALDGDVVMILPGQRSLHRLIRNGSLHNTFLVTEQCDQRCVMCSQPPKAYHVDLFDPFYEAALLAPYGTTIGISGGEPTLHKSRLFDFLLRVQERRPDIEFHILTNGQHFDKNDEPVLQRLDRTRILWGIPCYSASPETHDDVVAKADAFETLEWNIALLGRNGHRIELRTVVLNANVNGLADLSSYVTTHHPHISFWAIMQLEPIGYGRQNWGREFFDSSQNFDPIAAGVDIANIRGLETVLYNFPLCTVPEPYRRFCANSISDWKQKYLPTCSDCSAINRCTGFFEWYPEERGFSSVGAL